MGPVQLSVEYPLHTYLTIVPWVALKNEVIMNNALKLIHVQHGELKFNHQPSYIIAPWCGRIIPELRSRMRWNRHLQLIILSFRLQYKTVHRKLRTTWTKEKLSTVTNTMKTYLRTHKCPKTEGLVLIGDYTNVYEHRLHCLYRRCLENRKYHNLRISWWEAERRKWAYHRWIRINNSLRTIYQR